MLYEFRKPFLRPNWRERSYEHLTRDGERKPGADGKILVRSDLDLCDQDLAAVLNQLLGYVVRDCEVDLLNTPEYSDLRYRVASRLLRAQRWRGQQTRRIQRRQESLGMHASTRPINLRQLGAPEKRQGNQT